MMDGEPGATGAHDKEPTIAVTDSHLVFLGTYYGQQAASDDLGVVKDLHMAGSIGAYGAAVIERGEDGHVHICRKEASRPRGSDDGIDIESVIAAAFPRSIVELARLGHLSGRAIRNQAAGNSHAGLEGFNEMLGNGQAALVVLGECALADALTKARLRAVRHLTKEVGPGLWLAEAPEV